MLEALKQEVCAAILELVPRSVVIYTWGNVSGIDRGQGLVVIKPSGVDYDGMKVADLRTLASAKGISTKGMKKADIIKALAEVGK